MRDELAISWQLARRELRSGLKGLRLFLLCLVLGVGTIAGVQSLTDAVTSGLQHDGQRLLGGDLALRRLYQPLPQEVLDWLAPRTQGYTHFILLRSMARHDEQSLLVELKGVDEHWPLVDGLRLADGATLDAALTEREGQFGVAVDQQVLQRLDLALGDALQLGDLSLPIRAMIDSEADRIGEGGFELGPRVLLSQAALEATQLLQPGSLAYHHYRFLSLDAPQKLARDLRQQFSDGDWRIWDYRNASPRLEAAVARLGQFLTLVGLTALLVGGVGIGNAVRAWLAQRLESIATLKCIGATRSQVRWSYRIQLMLLASVGIVGGLAVGALLPWGANLLLGDWLPFALDLGVKGPALVLAALFGLLVALAFISPPLEMASRIRPGMLFRSGLELPNGLPQLTTWLLVGGCAVLLLLLALIGSASNTLALVFCAVAIASLVLFRLLAAGLMGFSRRLGRPSHALLRLALANLHRPGSPAPGVVLSLGLGLFVLATIALIESNLARQLENDLGERAPSFFLIDVQNDQLTGLAQLPGADTLDAVPYLRGRVMTINGQNATEALIDEEHAWILRSDRGVSYSATQPAAAQLLTGQWWPEDYIGAPQLSIHEDVAQAFGIGPGDRMGVSVLGRTIEAEVANVRRQPWQSMQINFTLLFSPEPLRHAPHGYLATLDVPEDQEIPLQAALARDFGNVSAVRVRDALETVSALFAQMATAIRAVAVLTLISGLLVLAGAIAAGHQQRVQDCVVLKVMGATRSDLLRAYLIEYGLLGLSAAVLAGLLGCIASWAVLHFLMESTWAFSPLALIGTLVAGTALSILLGFIGAWRALGVPAGPLLRND